MTYIIIKRSTCTFLYSQELLIHSKCVPRPQWDPGNVDGSNSYILCHFAHNTYRLDKIKN